MLPPTRTFSPKQGLEKRDDDLRPRKAGATASTWSAMGTGSRLRRRRFLFVLLALLIVYLFVKNIPTDLGPAPARMGFSSPPSATYHAPGSPDAALRNPQARLPLRESAPTSQHNFNGPIKFYKLASSLHAIAKTMGHRKINRNILFAAASLQSATTLIPTACEMARWRRNFVHFALMGRGDITIQELLEINGIGDECEVYWHDARPDFSIQSTDFRMSVSVSTALNHLNEYIHPQAIITDAQTAEEEFFTKSIQEKAEDIGRPVIFVPKDAVERLKWITRLDSGSLGAWNKANVDILVNAPIGSSGTLIRLLQTLAKADYFLSQPPRLTIELPANVDLPTQRYLESFKWPPWTSQGKFQSNQLTLRHRVPRQLSTTEDASSRFVESFYPANPVKSHVLVLSPQAELSPLYFHYLKYTLLEYKYSNYGAHDSEQILGVSLELPSQHLNETAAFEPPRARLDTTWSNGEQGATSFLWEAPNSNAALYFGDKWVEFHNFLSNRMQVYHSQMEARQPSPPRKKLVSEKYPAWMEYMLELIRARGYSMLYPAFKQEDALVVVHNELYQIPEEFQHVPGEMTEGVNSADPENPPPLDPNEPFLTDPSTHKAFTPLNEPPLGSRSIVSMLPYDGDLPEVAIMPHLTFDGREVSAEESINEALAFKAIFQSEVGGCPEPKPQKVRPMGAIDLFCLQDEETGGEYLNRDDEQTGAYDAKGVPAVSNDIFPSEDKYGPAAGEEKTTSGFAFDETSDKPTTRGSQPAS
ncbi:hypothetical protein L228DRAFT_281881 [Xylona heveae TC161]|uniref:Uncharacterized protein n=1 Tax=Xylona heveae (strain CBS 132557 / TC161) TaxID=1328760 RepID=A0A165H8F8_XYLHT|nr:hypothetical protein L228DRAFT_281881 [Xylona heveae TC161]KZF23130.1 hypothetical protein L228DRAFT_281881 [Xylona heveae TC161]